jgi:hypothetical protein
MGKVVTGEAAEGVHQNEVEWPRQRFCVVDHFHEYRTIFIGSGGPGFDVLLYELMAKALAPGFGLAHLIRDRKIGLGLPRR